MPKKFMTFKHWKTGETKTIEFREADVPSNPSSERLVVWNETEQKLEDIIKSTIVEIREERVAAHVTLRHLIKDKSSICARRSRWSSRLR